MDLLLDVNIVIDICQPRPAFSSLALQAIAKCHAEGGRMWLYTGSVQTLEYSLAGGLIKEALSEGFTLPMPEAQRRSRRLIQEFARDKHWLVATQPIKTGELFSADNITAKRPGVGISPMRWDEVLGQVAQKDYEKDELI